MNTLLGLLLLFTPMLLFGQIFGKKSRPDNYEDVVYNKEFTAGLKLHTNGWGGTVNFTKIHSIFKKRTYEIELMNIKHPKEVRQQSLFASGRNTTRGFIYGKQNSFFNINANIGWSRSLAEKARRNGVELGFFYAFGPSIGFTKPYYLELITDVEGNFLVIEDRKYDPESEEAALFLNPSNIYGYSGFLKGFNEIRIHPGVQAKVALNFDWASYNEFVKSIEVGAMVSTYFKRIPIMVEESEDNKFFFLNLYLRFMLGKRW